MSAKISIEDVKFFQDAEAGKTVAVLEGHALDAYLDFLSELGYKSIDASDVFNVPEQFMLPSKITSVSTCHGTDKWDPDQGKNQAFFKLNRQYNKMKMRAIKRVIEMNNSMNVTLFKLNAKYEVRVGHYDRKVRNPSKRSN